MLLLILGCRSSQLEVQEKGTTEDTAILQDFDGDGYLEDEDCDDTSQNTYPGAQEICDGVDNNCDGSVDEGVSSIFYADEDGDGFGNESSTKESCSPEEGFVAIANDCDDEHAEIYPGAAEICDERDNDCDGVVDGETAINKQDWYLDTDEDGFGTPNALITACFAPLGYTADSTDCDDSDGSVHPEASEQCNALDDDCDGDIDEDITTLLWYPDTDEDGFGDNNAVISSCLQPEGFVFFGGDCDDADSSQYPNAEEYCNNEDDDCDGSIDEGGLDSVIWYADADSDGFGDVHNTIISCSAPSQYVSIFGDCDDNNSDVYPEANEYCNNEDDNCDGSVDESTAIDATIWYADADADGYGDVQSPLSACIQPFGHILDTSDCDDSEHDINPEARELCDGVDNNCDGITDGVDAWAETSQPYRIPFTVNGGSYTIDQPPVLLEIDFRAALDTLGDTSAFAPSDIRIVYQDCSLGAPDIPSQFLDNWLGIREKSEDSNPNGDEEGTVVFLYDEDGDISTKEVLGAGDVQNFALYFGGGLASPTYQSSLVATAQQISTGVSVVDFDPLSGGLISSITIGSSPSLMSQASSCCGNGPYISSWGVDPQDGTGQLTLLESGPIFAAVEAYGQRGDAQGSYEYSYVYWMFANRPEVYAKVHQLTTSDMTVSHPGSWVSGLRPWESMQSNISSGATFSNDSTAMYADTQGVDWGITYGYIQPPTFSPSVGASDPYLVGGGNDWDDSAGTPTTIPQGVSFFDYILQVVMPHEETWSVMQEDFWAIQEGTSVTISVVEAQ